MVWSPSAKIARAAFPKLKEQGYCFLSGTVKVRSASGYRLDASNVAIDLKTRTLAGQGGVNGALNIGQFSANELSADLDQRVVRLQGNARLRINQGVLGK